MTTRSRRFVLVTALTMALMVVVSSQAREKVPTYTYKLLHAFKGGLADGANSVGALVRDAAGNLYGVTTAGGSNGNVCPGGCGAVFKLNPAGRETILHFFTAAQDGAIPSGPLVMDEVGNLYGTTSYGGDPTCLCGTVYKLDPQGNLTVLHTFRQGLSNTGTGPAAGLARDSHGNLYGTTYQDGSTAEGAGAGGLIFKIDPGGAFSILHVFRGWDGLIEGTPGTALNPGSGASNFVLPPLTVDAAGNLYGVTTAAAGIGLIVGGLYQTGTVFELDHSGAFRVLYNFALNPAFPLPGNGPSTDGCYPYGAPFIDNRGTLFGTTAYCGGADNGNIFKLEKGGTYSIIHTFPPAPNNFGNDFGSGPEAGLISDPAGNLYGTSVAEGAYGYGSVFTLVAGGKYQDVYSFKGQADGALPYAPVIRDPAGNLYGTALGGEWDQGVIYELIPQEDEDSSVVSAARNADPGAAATQGSAPPTPSDKSATVSAQSTAAASAAAVASPSALGANTGGANTGGLAASGSSSVAKLSPPLEAGERTPMRPKGHIVIPDSSIERPGDRSRRMHTNVRLFVPDEPIKPLDGGGLSATSYFETPASLACVYRLVEPVPGCDPALALTNARGGSRSIAIVDAFDDPNAAQELATYSSIFGLPPADFHVVYATGSQPPEEAQGWAIEEALDIEMAHAMAPNAKIYLVEAASDATSDLFAAVDVASKLVAADGGGEVSMSWGGSEWSGETAYDSLFTTPGIVYFASTGDGPGTQHPSVSPNVVAVGGTTLRRDAVSGYLLDQDAWIDGGGGVSTFEPRPAYQAGIAARVGSYRGVPDLAAVADPNTGVLVVAYATGSTALSVVGGTSVAAPLTAGLVNQGRRFAPSTDTLLTSLYSQTGDDDSGLLDIRAGFCGFYAGDAAVRGWDFCTGVGTPAGLGRR